MMRACLFTLLLLPVLSYAQAPQLTRDNLPRPGQEYFAYNLNNSGENNLLDPQDGITGLGARWDFSNLPAGEPTLVQWVAPANTPHEADYPSATVASNDNGGPRFFFFQITEDTYSLLADRQGDAELRFIPRQELASLPATLGVRDSTTYTVTGTPLDELPGKTVYVYDGFGTLLLPDASYESVFRLQYVGETDFQDNTVHTWVDSATGEVLLNINTSRSVFGVTTQEVQYKNLSANTLQPQGEALAARVYPNPATEHTTLRYQSPQAITLQLTDVLGNRHIRQRLPAAPAGAEVGLQLQGLAPGLYFVQLTDTDGRNRTLRLQHR